MNFLGKLKNRWDLGKFVCVGLDPDYSKLPQNLKNGASVEDNLFSFNQNIIDQTADLVCAYKLQSAFYEVFGEVGWKVLKKTALYIQEKYPDIPIILDAKRGDIGSSNEAYATAIFDYLGFDAVTVHPYLGEEALEPFLKRTDKGIIVLVRTSNPGAPEFQDLIIEGKGVPLYQVVAENVTKNWNHNGNLGVVVGATYPEELKKVREIVGDLPILIPGIGAQGGDIEETVKAGQDSKGQGMIISSSRGIIFSDNPKQAALKLHGEIQAALKK